MNVRTDLLAKLAAQHFDVLIIGGGIVGAGIARDAAMRGLRTALVEQGDFAGGTSSKTSKLIHGGLRYLEHGRIGLVRESLDERATLQTIAPELVRPLSLMIPIYRGESRSRHIVRAGLLLYDLFALGRGIHFHRMLTPSAALEREARIRSNGLQAAAMYADCQMNDARLCLGNVLQAIDFGAVCCNYVRVTHLIKTSARLSGAVVQDALTGHSCEVHASVVINATGPWSDAIRRMSDRETGARVAPTKGTHLIVPSITRQALCLQVRRDRRILFVLPWGQYSLIGTTESTNVGDLDRLHADADEVHYLLAEVNRALPEAHLEPTDVVATFTGARPLLGFSGSSTGASREHEIEVDRFGLVSIMGGKFTTYRVMAQQTLDVVLRHFRGRAGGCLTDQIRLLEPSHPIVLDRWQDVTKMIPQELLARLLTRYGTGAFRILRLLEFEPHLLEPICPHHDCIQAELVYSLQEELACTISDLLFRRTWIAYSRCQGLDGLATIRDLFHRYARSTPDQLDEQVERYRQQLADSLAFRMDMGLTLTRAGDADGR